MSIQRRAGVMLLTILLPGLSLLIELQDGTLAATGPVDPLPSNLHVVLISVVMVAGLLAAMLDQPEHPVIRIPLLFLSRGEEGSPPSAASTH